ncbi:acetyltransferase [Xylariales sp. PMI_506]|nr:acetyltransferase [Xylariales sp. PMI_506]
MAELTTAAATVALAVSPSPVPPSSAAPTPLALDFRVATPADAPRLLRLIGSAYRGESSRAGWTTEADLAEGDRIDEAGLLAKINAADAAFLIVLPEADRDDPEAPALSCCEIVWKPEAQVTYFGLFAVDPARQGGGVGRRVLEYAEAYARGRWAARSMEMQVIGFRADIIAWYGRRGYFKSGETREFPFAELALMNGRALRDDLYFEVLVKKLDG